MEISVNLSLFCKSDQWQKTPPSCFQRRSNPDRLYRLGNRLLN